jgi:hypothetical protein
VNHKRILFVGISLLFLSHFAFAQTETTNDGVSKAHSGVIFNLPAGDWWPIPEQESLAPNIDNKLQEQLERKKKITIIFSSQNSSASVLDILTAAPSNLYPKWDGILTIETPHMISDRYNLGTPMKFSAVYRVIDMQTYVAFRVEVVVATQWKQKGNRGILYIITPEALYYQNRYDIAKIRDALSMSTQESQTKN